MNLNVLNPIENQTPDLPMIRLDACPFDLAFTKASTPEKIQFVVGCVDGTIRMYTAKPTEEWWTPDTYEEEDDEYDLQRWGLKPATNYVEPTKEDDDEDSMGSDEDMDEDLDDDDDDGDVPQFTEDWRVKHSLLSVRSLARLPNAANAMVSVTRDGSLGVLDLELGKLSLNVEHANACGFEVAKAWDDNLIICGDEDGAVTGYDLRVGGKQTALNTKPKAAAGQKVSAKHAHAASTERVGNVIIDTGRYQLGQYWRNDDHADYVTDLAFSLLRNQVAFTSADAHLSLYDARKGEFIDISGRDEDELMSVCYLKEDSALLCGTDKGPISMYKTEDIFTYSDRYKVHECSVDHLVQLDQDTVLTAGEDGILRVVMIKPSRVIGVVGVHKDVISGVDVWRPSGATDADDYLWANDIIGTCSHDYSVRFWRVQDMQMLRRTRTTKELNDMKKARMKGVKSSKDSDDDFSDDDFGDDFDSDSDAEAKSGAAKKAKAGKKDKSVVLLRKEVASDDDEDDSEDEGEVVMDADSDDGDDGEGDEDDDLDDLFGDEDDEDGADEDMEGDEGEADEDGEGESEEEEEVKPTKADKKSGKKEESKPQKGGKAKKASAKEADSDDDFGDDFGDDFSEEEEPKDKAAGKTDKKKDKKKKKKARSEASAAEAVFSAEKFRKKHNATLAGAHDTGLQKQREERKRKAEEITQAKQRTDRVQPLPDITRKMPAAKKIKHGSSNFFNGL